uniref:Uncharacterized protein n=4 Tax=Nothobranchius furzeri TaxID=105023 RepID=A0A8C6LX66_NOTFU
MYENEGRDVEPGACIVPRDDDIEKSFCVNPDGSMTVEMKVRLTIKEQELLYWTTTLSRSSLSRRKVCTSGSASERNSPDSNNVIAKDSSNVQEDETKEDNCHNGAVSFNDEQTCKSFTSTTLGKATTRLKRTPTPGPRHVNKKTSVESVKVVTETGVQESTKGHYSYTERTRDGETAEEFCIVRHSSSSSSRPMAKPRTTASSGASNERFSTRTSGEAEVLQIQNNGMEVTETVMHIYESQGCYDNYFANEEYSADAASLQASPSVAESKPSTDSGPLSSSNDCDIDCNWQPPNAESLQRQKEEMLSLSSEPESLTRQVANNPSPALENKAVNTQSMEKVKTENTATSIKRKKIISSTASTNSTDKTRKEIRSSRHSKHSSTDKMSSDASVGKKSLSSSEKSKSVLNSKGEEKSHSRPSIKDQPRPQKGSALSLPSENVTTTPPKRINTVKAAGNDNSLNVNSPIGRPRIKKNMSDILPTKKSSASSTRTIGRPKSLMECQQSPPKLNVELSESGSIPSLNPSPSEIHQYVEDWLEKVSPNPAPYAEELMADDAEARTKVVFKLGDDSESEEVTDHQTNVSDAMKKSSSCLSVPLFHEGPATPLLQGEQRARGLCVSMPSVRADPLTHENKLRLHKSAEAIGPDESAMSLSNMLSPKDKMKPVLQQLCSSIQCIRRTSDAAPTLQNSSSLPNFSTQVASVFGSSCKAFLSFLSVMTLKDNLKGSPPAGANQSRTTSEAMLMMESLQKISTMEDEEKQRASLTDLQSRASSQFRERWKDFQIMRERFESEPLSPRVSETEFALDVVSEGGDLFEERRLGLDELMDELNMPQDLREEIASTIQSFYPVDESTFVETVKHESDSEEDVELLIGEDETKLSPEADSSAEDLNEARTEFNGSEESEINKPPKDEEVEEGNPKENEEKEEWKREEGVVVRFLEKAGNDEKQKDWEEERISGGESDEKGRAGITEDEEVMRNRLEGIDKDQTEENGEGLADETGHEGSVEDTDEREGANETEEEEKEAETLIDESQEEGDNFSEDVEEEERMGKGELHDEDEEEPLTDGRGEEEGEKLCYVGVEEEGKGENDDRDEAEALSDESQKKVENPCDVEKGGNSEEDEETIEHEEKEVEENGLTEEAEEGTDEKWKVSEEKCEEANREEGNDRTDEGENKEEVKQLMKEVIERNVNEEEFSEEYKSEQKEKDDTEEERCDQAEKDRNVQEVESTEEGEVIDELGDEENMTVDEEERVSDEEERPSEHRGSCQGANLQDNQESPSQYSSEGQCEDDKGRDTAHETDEGGEEHEAGSISLSHPGEISQELLDFVNNALQSHSLVFTYDTQGNLRIVTDNARVVQPKQGMIPKAGKDNSYGLKCLPSPITSDLSDYRPETSGSGGYKTQESEDIVSENGEDAPEKQSIKTQSSSRTERRNQRRAVSNVSAVSSSEALQNSSIGSVRSSSDAGTKSSREDLSYFSAASSLKAEAEAQNAQSNTDGVLIDQGRWLLKENHLIRKSPPVSLGMYRDLDSTSVDTAHGNMSEDSPPYTKTQHDPLAAISSSELEEMAKPLTPKCTYYNMPHGSDSDPFLDDVSDRSVKLDASSVKARGFRVSPAVDTSKTWTNRNGSLSSFASVEFKIPDRKVHPEGESSAVRQTRRTSSGEQGALQPQDSLESLHLRCGQYCPIL